MAFLFICTRQGENLIDYGIFGRDMAPVIFEDTVIGVALWHDKCSDMPEFCFIQGVPTRIYLKDEVKRLKSNGLERNSYCQRKMEEPDSFSACPKCENKYASLCNSCYQEVKANKKDDFILVYEPAYVRVTISRRTCISFASDLAFYAFRELKNSRTFRRRFCKYVRQKFCFQDMTDVICTCEGVQKVCELSFPLPYVIEIVIELAKSTVCLAWCYRLESLLQKRVILDETMAWLSTLGGAYSSLGDYFHTHSKMAGHISVTQLKISFELGDPIMAAKCRLFFALSLMQRGQLRKSKEMIRKEYNLAKNQTVYDQTLINMCLGMWSKLMFFRSKRKSRQCAMLGCHGNRNKEEGVYMDDLKTRQLTDCIISSCNDPKFSDRQVWANSVDPTGSV